MILAWASPFNPRAGQCLFDERFTAGIMQPSTEELIWVGQLFFKFKDMPLYIHRK